MANNRMYLVNHRLRKRIHLAKYYPSTGWYFVEIPSFPKDRKDKSFASLMDWELRYELESGHSFWEDYEVVKDAP